MRSRSIFKAGGAAFAVAALGLSLAAPASADIAPHSNDIVGVGSDTVQNMANFMADGDPSATSSGFNGGNPKYRLFSFDATPDANDRAGYTFGNATATSVALTPSIVLRAGTSPVQRPNGSGAGIAALIADKGTVPRINFARASRMPNEVEQQKAIDAGWAGGLHVVKLSTDNLKVAAANVTNAPTSLTAVQLVQLYECNTVNWNTIGGVDGKPIPQLPQSGSGTRNSFLADLKVANSNVDVPLGTCIQTVEENDPSTLNGPNTIAPFSEGRLNLFEGRTDPSGNIFAPYFYDPSVVFPGATTPVIPAIHLLGGYVDNRGLYVTFRDKDKSSTKKWQPGSTQNYVQALFLGTNSYAAGSDAAGAISAGGATPAYTDCGNGLGLPVC